MYSKNKKYGERYKSKKKIKKFILFKKDIVHQDMSQLKEYDAQWEKNKIHLYIFDGRFWMISESNLTKMTLRNEAMRWNCKLDVILRYVLKQSTSSFVYQGMSQVSSDKIASI